MTDRRTDERTDRRTDGRTDGGDCNIPDAFLKYFNIFLRFYLCIFEGGTVKSDCPVQENHVIFKDLIQTVGFLY